MALPYLAFPPADMEHFPGIFPCSALALGTRETKAREMGKKNKTDTCANPLSYTELRIQLNLELDVIYRNGKVVVC